MSRKLPQPKERLFNDNNGKLVKTRLLLKDSIINCIPTILGVIIWLMIIGAGFNWLSAMRIFTDEVIISIGIIIWIIGVAMPLIKIIPTPSLVYIEVYDGS